VSQTIESLNREPADVGHAVGQLVQFGKAAQDAGLLASTCGNASVRVDADHLVITASGSSLGGLSTDEVCVVRISDGAVVTGNRPSMELEMHRKAYLARPSTGAVLHCQSRSATLLACMVDPPANLDLIPEVPAYVRKHAYVDYAQPGTQALADGVADALSDPDVTVVQMVNHGQLVIGATWTRVIRRGQFFETACEIAATGVPLRHIPEAMAAELRGLARDV
jgi:L-fuculose-phosphate aldolase